MVINMAGERMRRSFRLFAQRAWPIIEPKAVQWNWHLDAICEHLQLVTSGDIRNLMILIPPRMTKTTLCSVLWPAWHWLSKPEAQFLGAAYEISLSTEAAAASRRLIESGWFQQFYARDFYLLPDANEKTNYKNNKGGYRITTSVNGKTAGFGGDIQLLDDPHNTKNIESDTIRANALAWHDNAWRSRMNDPNRTQKVYVAQRTHDADVLGHVMRQEGGRWVCLELPMEFDPARTCTTFRNKGRGVLPSAKPIFRDPRKIKGELLNPRRFNKETAANEKDVMSNRAWMAQYQQQPEGAGGLILKRHWWKQWDWPEWHENFGKKDDKGKRIERPLPDFFEIIQVYDTAFEEDEEADFTARTTWGLFVNTDPFDDPVTGKQKERERVCALMLDRYKDRPGFPELREEMIRSRDEHFPDLVLIEKKASGHSLIQEARRKDLPVKGVKIPPRLDLVARAHASSLMLEKGCIYYVPRNWSFDVINECAAFPQGEHDDQVSSCTMAWQYMRRYYDLTLPDDDENEDIAPFKWQKKKYA